MKRTEMAIKPTESYRCKCGHSSSEHFDPSYECGHAIEPDWAEGLSNYCIQCEEDSKLNGKKIKN